MTVFGVVVSSRASNTLAPEDRNLYDGKWVAEIEDSSSHQQLWAWLLNCPSMQGEFGFEVKDGVVQMQLLGSTLQAAISARGKFKLKELSEFSAHVPPSSDTHIFDSRVTNVLRGDLSGRKLNGRLDNWIQEAGAGCVVKVRFARAEGAASAGLA